MLTQVKGTLTGIKRSKGDSVIEGKPVKWDHTVFYIMSELPTKGDNARGQATQEYKFGKADEFEKWRSIPLPAVVDVELAMTTNGKGTGSFEVLSIVPNPVQPTAHKKAA